MGMFDYLRCDYPLPARPEVQGLQYQTKDFDCAMDEIHIRADGSLWGQDYDIEDHSDPNATGIARLAGMMTRVNVRDVPLRDFSGNVRFYADYGKRNKHGLGDARVEFQARFTQGQLVSVELVEEIVPDWMRAEDAAKAIASDTPQSGQPGGPRRI